MILPRAAKSFSENYFVACVLQDRRICGESGYISEVLVEYIVL